MREWGTGSNKSSGPQLEDIGMQGEHRTGLRQEGWLKKKLLGTASAMGSDSCFKNMERNVWDMDKKHQINKN